MKDGILKLERRGEKTRQQFEQGHRHESWFQEWDATAESTLGRQASNWFPAKIAKADTNSDTLLEKCILPRLQLSGLDAEYCFRMIKFLYEFSTPNFMLMSLYDRIFNHNRLHAIIFTYTVREAKHLARFLKLILGDLSKRYGDKIAYEKEALGLKHLQGNKTGQYLGFATILDVDADKFLEQLKTITEREAASKNAPESENGHHVNLSVTAQAIYSEL
ncbi:transcription factor/nuclear export subunit protein 2-domain-containing protein [Corynascus similis CBS 632.67]